MNINEMNAKELRDLITEAQARLSTLEAGMVAVQWKADWHRADRQRPYLAIVTKGTGKYPMDYNFISDFTKENSRYDSPCSASYSGSLPAGTILKARTGGSVKNEYLNFYIVDENSENGLREISANEAINKIR